MITQLKYFSGFPGASNAVKDANDWLMDKPWLIAQNIVISDNDIILIYKYDPADVVENIS